VKKIAILQPSYIPWIGYFEQILNVDIFVFYDDVQYTKNDWRNRNKIKAISSGIWLTVPIQYTSKVMINEALIDCTQKWHTKHLKTIKQYYGKSKYFNEIYPILEKHINLNVTKISILSINIIKEISNYLELNTKFYLSSELNIKGNKNSRLVNICKHFSATEYYSGSAAKEYLDMELFKINKINIKFQKYTHPIYKQVNGDFIPYLSIIDLLFNYGKSSIEIIKGKN